MAEMTITLKRDPDTGKQDIHIKLHEDPDSLPHEHEQMHRELVEKLVGKGVLKPEEAGNVIVEREDVGPAAEGPTSTPEAEREAQKQGE